MQALQLLHKNFSNNIVSVHTTRMRSLMDCARSLIRGKRLTLTLLGRHMDNEVKVRSNIRKVDRLVGNTHLYNERSLFYKQMNTLLISEQAHPWLHVDWSCLSSKNKLYVLRASLPVRGRAIVVYEETHPKSNENNHATHKAFLNNLKAVLPDSVKPVIVTDAGFRALWFDYVVKEMKWDFVGRIRNQNRVKLENQAGWQASKALYASATNTPKELGSGLLTKRTKVDCRFIVYKGKKKNRSKLNQNKLRCTSSKSKRYSEANKEPWLLATSFKQSKTLAKKVVGIYRERMQIEENFRDTKDRRYGFGLNESETRTTQRIGILLLICAIATFVCWIAGLVICSQGKAADYQAHSAKFTRVLSRVYLGCEALRKGLQITKESFWFAIETLSNLSSTESGVCP